MLVKVGELAKRAGLTVRTLHHYDEIGLLKPSGRSSSGYRLYNESDVARLHAIQALRQLGLSLAKIGDMLEEEEASLPAIVARQIRALDQEIAQARELRERLGMLDAALSSGTPPPMKDWLATLDLMATYRSHFTATELRRIFRNQKKTRDDWAALTAEVNDALARGVRADMPQAQQLAQRWMDLSIRWMQGDMDLAVRWGKMIQAEPAAKGQSGIDPALIRYMGEAIQLRMAAFYRHLTPQDMQRMDKGLGKEWQALAHRAQCLMQANTAMDSVEARALLADWDALTDRMADHDPALRAKLLQAYRTEPLLQMGHVIGQDVRAFIERIRAAA